MADKGSNDYPLWRESIFGYNEEKRIFRKDDQCDFRVFSSQQQIMDILNEKEKERPNSARMVAGFCWPWSNKVDSIGELVKNVKIDDFAMPWETYVKINSIPKGYVRWYGWAYRTEGIKQVGCTYTAQGFEFDYIGVIIGNDLCVDKITGKISADISTTKDPMLRRSPENFEKHVKNIYRTLLTRGMRGCYVYFMDKETEGYFTERLGK